MFRRGGDIDNATGFPNTVAAMLNCVVGPAVEYFLDKDLSEIVIDVVDSIVSKKVTKYLTSIKGFTNEKNEQPGVVLNINDETTKTTSTGGGDSNHNNDDDNNSWVYITTRNRSRSKYRYCAASPGYIYVYDTSRNKYVLVTKSSGSARLPSIPECDSVQ